MAEINLNEASPREVEEAVLAYAKGQGYGGYESWSWWRDEAGGVAYAIPDLGAVTTVQSDGGGHGEGEATSVVIKVEGESVTRYFKKTGYYSSYSGTEWDGEVRSVWPSTKTVTVYE